MDILPSLAATFDMSSILAVQTDQESTQTYRMRGSDPYNMRTLPGERGSAQEQRRSTLKKQKRFTSKRQGWRGIQTDSTFEKYRGIGNPAFVPKEKPSCDGFANCAGDECLYACGKI